MEITFRKYQPSDKKAFIRFTEENREYLMTVDDENLLTIEKGYGKVYAEDYLKKAKDSGGEVLIAETGGRLVGCGVGTIRLLTDKEKLRYNTENYKMGIISDLFVSEECRHHGVGSKLIHEFEKFFKEKGCKYSRMEVFGKNEKAHELYTYLGYGEYAEDLYKRI